MRCVHRGLFGGTLTLLLIAAGLGEGCAPPTCTTNADCTTAGEYCEKAAGDCGGTGLCATMPTACSGVFAPVCGCDGTTYTNACLAHNAGVSVDYTGSC